ncbi:uncharacterized protein LOC135128895 [Zophobas morio]|uniref:uncharacterized protein LOC135128895 n=1 Tax=Zophobas morio TaxID=2755281 RepID=UPI003082893C
MWKPQTISEILRPICILWRFCGLPVYKIENQKRGQKLITLQGFILFKLFTSLNIVAIDFFFGMNEILYSRFSSLSTAILTFSNTCWLLIIMFTDYFVNLLF